MLSKAEEDGWRAKLAEVFSQIKKKAIPKPRAPVNTNKRLVTSTMIVSASKDSSLALSKGNNEEQEISIIRGRITSAVDTLQNIGSLYDSDAATVLKELKDLMVSTREAVPSESLSRTLSFDIKALAGFIQSTEGLILNADIPKTPAAFNDKLGEIARRASLVTEGLGKLTPSESISEEVQLEVAVRKWKPIKNQIAFIKDKHGSVRGVLQLPIVPLTEGFLSKKLLTEAGIKFEDFGEYKVFPNQSVLFATSKRSQESINKTIASLDCVQLGQRVLHKESGLFMYWLCKADTADWYNYVLDSAGGVRGWSLPV